MTASAPVFCPTQPVGMPCLLVGVPHGGRCSARRQMAHPHNPGLPLLAMLQGFGDLFVIRVAGNCVSEHVMGRWVAACCLLPCRPKSSA